MPEQSKVMNHRPGPFRTEDIAFMMSGDEGQIGPDFVILRIKEKYEGVVWLAASKSPGILDRARRETALDNVEVSLVLSYSISNQIA